MVTKGFFRPSDEVTPVILGLLPEDFDHVQFRAVGREEAEKGVVVLHPAEGDAVVEAVMNAGVIEDDESRGVLGNPWDHIFHEFKEDFSIDRANHLLEVEMLAGKVQCAHDANPLMMRWQRGVRTADGRPGSLHGRRRTKARLVVVEQLASPFARPSLQAGKFFLAGGKSDRVPLFFKLIRVRLKLKPRALSVFPSVSSEQGSSH